jgi:hypothetical protein
VAGPRRDELGELAGIPALGEQLRRVASEEGSALRQAAVEALRALAEPASVPVLGAILDEPLPAPPGPGCEPPAQGESRPWSPPRACLEARARLFAAETLRHSAVHALAAHLTTEAVRRLAPLLVPAADGGGEQEDPTELYRLLARVGGPEAERALAALDHRRAPRVVGWNRLCQPGQAGAPPDETPCGAAIHAGTLEVAGASPGVWIRRDRPRAAGGPMLAFQDDLAIDVEEARQEGNTLIARGRVYAASLGQRRPWSVEIPTEQALADGDGDGVPDRTETFLGTDPAARDSDGDGKPDGDDPSPLARSARTGDRELVQEIVRYALLGQRPPVRVLYLYVPPEHRPELEAVAEVVLHRPPLPPDAREIPRPAVPGAAHVTVDDLQVAGDTATALVRKLEAGHPAGAGYLGRYPGRYLGPAVRLTLHRAGKHWRVVNSEHPGEERKD